MDPYSDAEKMEKWSKEAVFCMIDAYKMQPCLYVPNSPNYRNKVKRSESLRKVAEAVRQFRPGTTEDDVKLKMNKLRTQFVVELMKVRNSVYNGSSTEEVYQPGLWYFDKLSFLTSHISSRKNSTNSTDNSDGTVANTSNTSFPFTEVNVPVPVEENFQTEEESHSQLRSMFHLDPPRSEYAAFGEWVGRSIESLKSEDLKLRAQEEISRILFMLRRESLAPPSGACGENYLH